MNSKAVVLLLVVLWGFGSARAAHQQFCGRAEASKSCAKPPTVDDIFKVEEYLGKWYEIGSTASFKLLTEGGLACNQARYSASLAGKLSLLNSGLRVISRLAVAEVAAVNVAARGACAAARDVCYQLSSVGQLSHSLSNLSLIHGNAGAQLLQLSNELKSSAQAAQYALQNLSDDVSLIQKVNGQISQANYSSSLQSSVADIKEHVKEGGQEQEAVASLASTLNKIRGQVKDVSYKSGWSKESKAALEQAALSLGSIAVKVGASSTAIELNLKAVGFGANSLQGNGHPIDDPSVSSVTGSITQPNATAAAKLEVSINSNKAPYWIIALEKSNQGAYSAALVYSCREVAGLTAKSLFILSREPELEKATLDAFLAKAELLGIYNDCEDPFLLTVQRGGDCGQPSN